MTNKSLLLTPAKANHGFKNTNATLDALREVFTVYNVTVSSVSAYNSNRRLCSADIKETHYDQDSIKAFKAVIRSIYRSHDLDTQDLDKYIDAVFSVPTAVGEVF